MQFYFIRHGQSTNNALWDANHEDSGRTSDPELTELGRRQARQVAQLLTSGNPRGGCLPDSRTMGFGLTHLYTSLMQRAVATAAIISETINLPVEAWVDAHEEGGIYLEDSTTGKRVGQAGLGRSYFKKNYPKLILPENLGESGWWNNQPFEEPEMRPERARRFLKTLVEKHGNTDDRVAVVSHGGFYNQLLMALQHRSESNGVWALINNTGITRIDFHEPYIDLVYLNRTDHLPIDLLT
jgi:2,3-bisphosphoglycerate-dependent phosphoglycerate mutase